MSDKFKGRIIGKTIKDGVGLIDVWECDVCGWRFKKRPEQCENPICGSGPKAIWSIVPEKKKCAFEGCSNSFKSGYKIIDKETLIEIEVCTPCFRKVEGKE